MAARKQSEEQKLVAFFRTPDGETLGAHGDQENLTPAGTAIWAMGALRQRTEDAESMLASITGVTRLELVANEREACAKLAEESLPPEDRDLWGIDLGEKIRARGVR